MCIHIQIQVRHVSIHMHVLCMHAYINMHINKHIRTCMHTRTLCVCVYTYICVYIYTFLNQTISNQKVKFPVKEIPGSQDKKTWKKSTHKNTKKIKISK